MWPHWLTLAPEASGWLAFAKEHLAWVEGQIPTASPDPVAQGELGSAELAMPMIDSIRDWYQSNLRTLNTVHICVGLSFGFLIVETVCWAGAVIR